MQSLCTVADGETLTAVLRVATSACGGWRVIFRCGLRQVNNASAACLDDGCTGQRPRRQKIGRSFGAGDLSEMTSVLTRAEHLTEVEGNED